MKVCAAANCPALTSGRYCPAHQRTQERKRGTPSERGYGRDHRALRAQWAPAVAAGNVNCARCGKPIAPDTAWDLGHSTDRKSWAGPEHANTCNRAAGGRSAHA